MHARRQPPWIRTAMKNTSHHWRVRAPAHVVLGLCRASQGTLLTVHRDYDQNTDEFRFRAYLDSGNVAYHDYVQYFMTAEEYRTVFMLNDDHATTNSEMAGDIVEF